jgi:hypothetical protein
MISRSELPQSLWSAPPHSKRCAREFQRPHVPDHARVLTFRPPPQAIAAGKAGDSSRADGAGGAPASVSAPASVRTLFQAALLVPAFAAALATPDAETRERGSNDLWSAAVRSPALAARDVASAALAAVADAAAMALAWEALADAVCPGLARGQQVACVRGAVAAARRAPAGTGALVGAALARQRFFVGPDDLSAVAAAPVWGVPRPSCKYDVAAVQRAAHRRWGDANGVARERARRARAEAAAARAKAARAAARGARAAAAAAAARRAEVLAALATAGADAALTDTTPSLERYVAGGRTPPLADLLPRAVRRGALIAALEAAPELGGEGRRYARAAGEATGAFEHIARGAPPLAEVLARVARCREVDLATAGMPARSPLLGQPWAEPAFLPYVGGAAAPPLEALLARYARYGPRGAPHGPPDASLRITFHLS